MPYRKEYGLSRRFAPRNGMQRLAVCLRRKNVLPLKPAPAYAFALSTAYLRGCGLPQRFPACNDMPKKRCVRRITPRDRKPPEKIFHFLQKSLDNCRNMA